jgi:quinol monooxygenase YgiN
MHVQLVTFNLQGISEAELRAASEAIAPQFAALPGLHSKVWLAEPRSSTYGGIYTWQDRAAMQAYLDGELYAALRDNPAFDGVRSNDFGVLAAPTRITSPSLEAAA